MKKKFCIAKSVDKLSQDSNSGKNFKNAQKLNPQFHAGN